jgi:ferrous iron transport protein B
MNNVLLVGQPNVGKSVLYSRLTGLNAVTSNYPGTTISFTKGVLKTENKKFQVIDTPGVYSLEPIDEATKVTLNLIDDSDIIVDVIDSTHLERNLPLTLELIEQGKKVIVALNMIDEAHHKGVKINAKKLEKLLGVPVIKISAKLGRGVPVLIEKIKQVKLQDFKHEKKSTSLGQHPHIDMEKKDKKEDHIHLDQARVWDKIGNIIREVQTLTRKKHNFVDVLEDISVHPFFGFITAMFVAALSFIFVRVVGENLISLMDYLFNTYWIKFLNYIMPLIGSSDSFIFKILIGTLFDGQIDFMQSFGLLTSGIYIPIAAVMPYIFSFYLVISFLEDSGYLPRFAIFLDSFMHRIGLHGYAIIPNMLGLGCNVPGILATRILENKKQRFIVSTLISIAVPCAALQAMIFGTVGEKGVVPVLIVYGALFVSWLVIGIVLKNLVRNYNRDLLIEVPPYRLPSFKNLILKLKFQMQGFLKEALPVVLFSVLFFDILYHFHIFDYLSKITNPIIVDLWGLPEKSVVPILLGIIRKDVAVGMLGTLSLTTKQLIIGSIALSMFFPCLATFVILFKELGVKYAFKSVLVMLVSVTLVGFIMNMIL